MDATSQHEVRLLKRRWEERLRDNFRKNQSLENYVALENFRRGAGRTDFLRRAEFAPILDELKRAGMDLSLLEPLARGSDRAVEQVAFWLCEKLVERHRIERPVAKLRASNGDVTEQKRDRPTHTQARGEVINDALVDFLVVNLTAVVCNGRGAMPPALFFLVRDRLLSRTPRTAQRAQISERRVRAVELAVAAQLRGNPMSMNSIARELGVSTKTLSKSFGGEKAFRDAVEEFSRK